MDKMQISEVPNPKEMETQLGLELFKRNQSPVPTGNPQNTKSPDYSM